MRVLILGTGDAFTARHFGSSALIEAPQGWVLLDCPDPIHRVIREATERVGWAVTALDIHDILLTHLHGDHCNGLESFGFLRNFARKDGRVPTVPRIHTSGPVSDRLWERLAPAMDGRVAAATPRTIDDFYQVNRLTPDQSREVAGLTVRCRFTKHPVPTIGLLISDAEKTLGWSSDTPYDEAHIHWLSQADVIVHECNTGAAHTPIEALEALPREIRGKISLIHLPDDFDPASTGMHVLQEGELLIA